MLCAMILHVFLDENAIFSTLKTRSVHRKRGHLVTLPHYHSAPNKRSATEMLYCSTDLKKRGLILANVAPNSSHSTFRLYFFNCSEKKTKKKRMRLLAR